MVDTSGMCKRAGPLGPERQINPFLLNIADYAPRHTNLFYWDVIDALTPPRLSYLRPLTVNLCTAESHLKFELA